MTREDFERLKKQDKELQRFETFGDFIVDYIVKHKDHYEFDEFNLLLSQEVNQQVGLPETVTFSVVMKIKDNKEQ